MLLLLSCVYCVVRAMGEGRDSVDGRGWCTDVKANRSRTRWMALAGIAMGFAFLTKQLQAFLVLPGIGVAFLMASPTRLRRRLLDALVAIVAMVVAGGWWVLLTVVVPADMRPYFGGSETNSFVELTFMYNGLGRILGNTAGNGTMAAKGIQMSTGGESSPMRLLSGIWATQWSLLLPASVVGAIAALIASGRPKRTDSKRAQAIIWAGWLLVTFAVFSYMKGTIHQYYTIALVPAVAALVGICARVLWERRGKAWARVASVVAVAGTAAWSCVLVSGTDWLRMPLMVATGVLAAGSVTLMVIGWAMDGKASKVAMGHVGAADGTDGISTLTTSTDPATGFPMPARVVCVLLAVASGLTVPVAHSLYTATQGHHGSIVTAGPNVNGSDAMGGMGGGPGGMGGQGGPW